MLLCCARADLVDRLEDHNRTRCGGDLPVRSVELLSQTTTSVVQPAAANADEAAMAASDCGSKRSSLNAGMMMETFTRNGYHASGR